MKNGILTCGVIGAFMAAGALSATAQSQAAPSGPVPVSQETTTPTPGKAAAPVTAMPNGAAAPSATEKMAPIIVTGSAIPTTDTEGASPVVVIDSDTIQKRGYQTVQDVLRNLPQAGAINDPGIDANGFTPGAAYASLRGLGPQATLVLVNGRRVDNYPSAGNGQYGFVDLNGIPSQIVDRVEILTDGTALYGADAVAGVINIITKKNLGDENGEVDAFIGNTTNKDAFEQRYTIQGNLSSFDKNGYGYVEADYEHQDSILAVDRHISQNANTSFLGGNNVGSSREYPGYFLGENSGNDFTIAPGTGDVPLTGTTPGTDPNVIPGTGKRYNFNQTASILPETERHGLDLNYTYKFYDGAVTPNLAFDYRHNRSISTSAPAGYSVFFGDTGPNPANVSPALGVPAFIVPTTNPYNQTGEPIDILRYRFVQIGARMEDVDNDNFRAVPSVDIKLGDGWTLNAGFNYNYAFLHDRGINFPSAVAFQNELDDTNPLTAYNPFTSTGNQTAAARNGLYVDTGSKGTTSLIGEDFRLNGKVFDLPAGPVQMAFGGEYRLERYNQVHTDADTTGEVLASSIQLDTAASRKSLSGYVEFDIPITSPTFNCPGFYSMDVLADARVDKYSNFGSTANPQVRLRWETIPGLVFRGGYSKAFRAPSLPELAAGGNQAFVTVNDPVTGTQPEILLNSNGNPKLKPETAEIFSAGVAYTPDFAKGLLITFDFFKIRYSNQVTQEDAQTLIDEGSPQVTRAADGTITAVDANYENLNSSYISGYDWGANYVLGNPNMNWGQLTFTLNGTYLRNYVQNDGIMASEYVGTSTSNFGVYSRYRQDASITWDYQNFSLTVDSDYASGVQDTQSGNDYGVDRNVAANIYFNMQASYTFDKETIDKIAPGPSGGFDWRNIVAGTRMTVGCDNIYDFSPPFVNDPGDTLGYDQSSSNAEGRFIYGELTKKF